MTMASNSIKPWRVLALRANMHLATARLLLDLVLDQAPVPEEAASQVRTAKDECESAQSLVRQIAGVVPALLLALLLVGTTRAQENWTYTSSTLTGDGQSYSYTLDVVLPYLLPSSCSNCMIPVSYWTVDGNPAFASNAPNTSGVFDFFSNAQGSITTVHFVVTDGSTMLASVGASSSLPAGDSYIAPGIDLQAPTGTWVDPPAAVAAPELHFTTMVAALTLLLGAVAVLSGRRRT
jgi:hypothetical protein